mmetsp:Transcript_29065/g.73045  ORF Transcript_29065/g.73045 Transcript_29065/m.73045 type:complete len:97 (-) Transcript_29065:734-1024(-)
MFPSPLSPLSTFELPLVSPKRLKSHHLFNRLQFSASNNLGLAPSLQPTAFRDFLRPPPVALPGTPKGGHLIAPLGFWAGDHDMVAFLGYTQANLDL